LFLILGVGLVGEMHYSIEEATQGEAKKLELEIFTNFTHESTEKLQISMS